MLGRRWFAVYCHAQKEALAKEQLAQQGYDVYLPLYRKLVRHARKAYEKSAPLFPRYLFVGFNPTQEMWRNINSTRGVIKLVMQTGERPQTIKGEVIDELRCSQDDDGFVSLAALELFQAGQKVRILDGAFTGHIAVYQTMTDKQRVEILLHFLNQNVRMQLPVSAVEKVA